MAQSEKELEKQLTEDGNCLLSPPSVTKLLSLLDRVENALTRVEQSPSESMKKALSSSIKALISDGLLRHSDVDVKVSVASCISEITRITAPDAPYEDDQMKEVFKLIVSSFEQLDDKASPSYIKRTSILETVAKVRSCVVMLDLECDDLIVEMFGHFFRSIRILKFGIPLLGGWCWQQAEKYMLDHISVFQCNETCLSMGPHMPIPHVVSSLECPMLVRFSSVPPSL